MSENIENAVSVVAGGGGDDTEDDDVDDDIEENAGTQEGGGVSRRGFSYTATEDLMVAKAYIRATEDSINGSKQKLTLFKAKLASTYRLIKKEQEQFERVDSQKPSHLRVFQNATGTTSRGPEPYPARTGSSIYQHFKGKIQPEVIKFISVRNQVSNVDASWLFYISSTYTTVFVFHLRY